MKAGRKRSLTNEQVARARKAHNELKLPWRVVAQRMGISMWTLRDYLRPARKES